MSDKRHAFTEALRAGRPYTEEQLDALCGGSPEFTPHCHRCPERRFHSYYTKDLADQAYMDHKRWFHHNSKGDYLKQTRRGGAE